ncbi:hypothetical protein ASG92_06590 [Arthrobacter sp. Soil736]|uniref:hypothetical protein n=1 Tax=Arthrobacter sp. Soil736 TaxID=1736395 RepID=UPI00070217B4|nr:hypothetical protein [Arthrobacter sp. Soil736]KRE53203.1 hypothetical protein ASG92_06590 [Arthrobacter sp. Soil736]
MRITVDPVLGQHKSHGHAGHRSEPQTQDAVTLTTTSVGSWAGRRPDPVSRGNSRDTHPPRRVTAAGPPNEVTTALVTTALARAGSAGPG